MERKDFKKIDSLLHQFVKAHGLERGLAEYRLMKSWKDLLGITVAKKTKYGVHTAPYFSCQITITIFCTCKITNRADSKRAIIG